MDQSQQQEGKRYCSFPKPRDWVGYKELRIAKGTSLNEKKKTNRDQKQKGRGRYRAVPAECSLAWSRLRVPK